MSQVTKCKSCGAYFIPYEGQMDCPSCEVSLTYVTEICDMPDFIIKDIFK